MQESVGDFLQSGYLTTEQADNDDGFCEFDSHWEYIGIMEKKMETAIL